MDNFFKYKLLRHPGRLAFARHPITAEIFLTNYCNNDCQYCTYKRWWKSPPAPKYITTAEFVKYARRMTADLGVKGIILTGGGEPTLNPDFEEITGWLEANDVHYGINTNFNNPVFIKPDYLKVSLDGYDEDSYEARRGVRAYEKTINNIRAYAMWKKENSPNTSLGIQWVATNVKDVRRFYEANAELDVDYISLRPVESTRGEYYLSAGDSVAEIMSEIERLKARDSRVTASPKWEALDWHFDKCYAQWAQIAVNENGEVMYCCQKPYEIVGHIMDEDILDKKAAAYTNMSMCDVPCRMTFSNELMRIVEGEVKDEVFI